MRNAFGIDISDTSIEAAEISKKLGKLVVASYGRREIEPGIVEGGRILHRDKLVTALTELVKSMKPRHPNTSNVILSIPESRTFIHVFQLPSVISEDNIGESIQYKAEEIIPLSFDQIDFDYQILTKGKDFQEVLYVGAFKDTVNDYHDVVRRAGLNPIVFEPESTSLARSLVRDDIFEGVLIADIGARTTILTVYDHHGIRHSENIPLAGNYLTKIAAETLKIAPQAAEAMKREVGLVKKDALAQALGAGVTELAQAMKKAINYYQKKTGFVMTKIIVCGGTSLMPGLVEFLQSSLGITVLLGDPLASIQHDKKAFVADQAVVYATVIGLALRGADKEILDKGINLIAADRTGNRAPKTVRSISAEKTGSFIEKRKSQYSNEAPSRKRLFIMIGIFVFLIIVFAGIFLWQRSRSDTIRSSNLSNQEAINTSTANGVEVVVYTQAGPDKEVPAGAIAGRLISTTVRINKEFPATGKKAVSRTTSGIITIINNYSQAQSLVATTRFVTSAGILFRLKDAVTVPAGGTTTAEVYADDPGALPEVSPTRLTIPGLSSSLQDDIYGELATTIGSMASEVTVVSDGDIAKADTEMSKELNIITAADLGQEVKTDEVLVPHLFSSTLTSSTTSKKVNEAATTFTLTREFQVSVLIISRSVLQEKMNNVSTDLVFSVRGFNQDSGLVTLRVTSQ